MIMRGVLLSGALMIALAGVSWAWAGAPGNSPAERPADRLEQVLGGRADAGQAAAARRAIDLQCPPAGRRASGPEVSIAQASCAEGTCRCPAGGCSAICCN
jgi:hypothetical protein